MTSAFKLALGARIGRDGAFARWQALEVLRRTSPEAATQRRRAKARSQKGAPAKRPRFDAEPDDDAKRIVSNMASYGFSLHQILRYTGLHKAQMRFCKKELQTAAITRDLTVVQSAYLQSVGGPERNWKDADGTMTRFWLERKMGWRPPPERSLSLNANLDLDKLSEAQLEQLEALMEAAAPQTR
jgi:hypothetical protein